MNEVMKLSGARILLVDDDALHLEIFSEWLSSYGCVVTPAPDGETALSMMRAAAFDVSLIDLRMPGMSGLELLEHLKQRDPSLEVIVLTGSGTMQDAIAALRQGRAFDFVVKPIADLHRFNEILVQALECRRIKLNARLLAPSPPAPFLDELTPRERVILSFVVRGLRNRDISEHLQLSEKTVRNALTHIYEKLKVTSRAEAIVACKSFAFEGPDR